MIAESSAATSDTAATSSAISALVMAERVSTKECFSSAIPGEDGGGATYQFRHLPEPGLWRFRVTDAHG